MGVSDYLRKSTTFTTHAADPSRFYTGSRVLQPLADSTGMPIDQINLIVSLFASTILAMIFHLLLSKSGTLLRHLVELIAGIAIAYFCFGNQIVYIFIQATVSYLIMRLAPLRYQHLIVLGFCFIYLSATHIIRLIYDYGGYTLDVTLPLMILTQRLTSLAFSVHDGFTSLVDSLPHDQKFLAVQRFPSLLEFYSYTFYFHGILCGPFVHYADYISFVECRNWTRFSMPNAAAIQSEETGQVGNNARPAGEAATIRIQLLNPPEGEPAEPDLKIPLTNKQMIYSSLLAGLKSLAIAWVCGFLLMSLAPMFPISTLNDTKFLAEKSFFHKTLFLYVAMFLTRQRYYFAWKFCDAVNIFSGLSYSGITLQGKALWRLTDNIDIREFELGTRFAVHINAWNKTTSNWLRFMIYDRAPWHPTLLTFLASALWHGFYPGYYIAFLTATLFLQAVRVVRSSIRPVCELHIVPRRFYDLCAFTLVRLASSYMVLPFILMNLQDSFRAYRSLYCWLHGLAVAALVILPIFRRFLPESMRQKRVYGRARSAKKQHEGESVDSPNSPRILSDADSGAGESDADPMKPKAE